jgi:TolB-like protein
LITIVRVGRGVGFVVEIHGQRLVLSAAHNLPVYRQYEDRSLCTELICPLGRDSQHCPASLSGILYSRNHSALKIRSLAVLPLENLSGDASQDYFADGMTDESIAQLGQISALRVISRTSVMTCKGIRKPLAQIAAELDIDAVVEGSALRSGERVRITAQLIQVRDDKHVWAQSYEGDIRDTLALQSKVARTVAEQIRVTLSRYEKAALGRSKPVNPEAFQAHLAGQKDPNYAEAYTGLADAYALSGDWEYGILSPEVAFPKAKVAASKALQHLMLMPRAVGLIVL